MIAVVKIVEYLWHMPKIIRNNVYLASVPFARRVMLPDVSNITVSYIYPLQRSYAKLPHRYPKLVRRSNLDY